MIFRWSIRSIDGLPDVEQRRVRQAQATTDDGDNHAEGQGGKRPQSDSADRLGGGIGDFAGFLLGFFHGDFILAFGLAVRLFPVFERLLNLFLLLAGSAGERIDEFFLLTVADAIADLCRRANSAVC